MGGAVPRALSRWTPGSATAGWFFRPGAERVRVGSGKADALANYANAIRDHSPARSERVCGRRRIRCSRLCPVALALRAEFFRARSCNAW